MCGKKNTYLSHFLLGQATNLLITPRTPRGSPQGGSRDFSISTDVNIVAAELPVQWYGTVCHLRDSELSDVKFVSALKAYLFDSVT